MDSKEKDIVFSEAVKAGKRIYYLDVKQSRNGDRYISITESKKIVEGEAADNPHISFEKHKIFLYKEDFDKFATALNKVIDFVRRAGQTLPSHQPSAHSESSTTSKLHLSDVDLHLDIDF